MATIQETLVYPYIPFMECLKEKLGNSSPEGEHWSVVKVANLIYEYSKPTISALFSKDYDLTFSPSISSLDEANVFLLGEFHSDESTWRQLNGRFISYLSQFYRVVVFLEGVPHLMKVTSIERAAKIYHITMNPNISFLGWDFNGPKSKEMSELLDEIRLLKHIITNIGIKIKKIEIEIEVEMEYITSRPDFSDDELSELKAKEKMREDLIKHRSMCDLEKAKSKLNALIKETFPERTNAMVSTLKAIQDDDNETKFIFIAGLKHLKELGPEIDEYNLDLLYEELDRQKAAVIMIPEIEDPAIKMNLFP